MKKLFLFIPFVFFLHIAFAQTTYTFAGNGYWTAAPNWTNNTIPPSVLPAGDTIVINPGLGDSCVLNVAQTISQGAFLIIAPGANFIVSGGVAITSILPVVYTDTVSNITNTSATCGGIINGGFITASGLVWDTLPNPTVSLNTIVFNSALTDTFSNNITGLQPGIRYYVRAFAVSGAGTAYGNERSFFTAPLPRVYTEIVSNISTTSATCGGIINGSFNTNGLVWDTVPYPTIVLATKTVNGVISDTFSNNITGLLQGKTYYVRAYASNINGTSYGNQRSFVTVPLPIVYTVTVSSITTSSAISGGIINGISITASGLVWDTLPGATTALATKTTNSVQADTFSNNITHLQSWKTYYVRAYAANITGTVYGNEISFTTPQLYLSPDSSFTDPRDGQVYTFRHIGQQVWMTQNLNYVALSSSWCYNNSAANCPIYGHLYNFNAALTAAPPGWHLPSDAEWQILVDNLGGDSLAGGKMKEAGTTHWSSPNTGADNSSGFTGLPGGRCIYYNTVFQGLGSEGNWWTSTVYDNSYSRLRGLTRSNAVIAKYITYKTDWLSIRCIRN